MNDIQRIQGLIAFHEKAIRCFEQLLPTVKGKQHAKLTADLASARRLKAEAEAQLETR